MSFRIVCTISAYDIFGAERQVINECLFFQAKGFKVTVVLILPNRNSVFLEKVKELGLPCYHLISNSKFDLSGVFKLRDFLKENKCDLVHSHKYKPDILSLIACRMLGIPVVTTVHGWCSEDLKARIYEKIQAFSWRYFNRVICVSESYKQKVLQWGVSEAKVTVIHNGIMADDYTIKEIESKRISFLKRHNIPTNHFTVGIIGRLSIEKGHRYFLEAAQKVLKQESNLSFIIVGDGSERSRIRELIDRLGLNGRIHMIGYIQDMKEIYAALDTVVIASLREGLPIVLLEAMLCEKPVIATNVGGIPEVIRNNEDGLLVPSEDSLSIAYALITLIRSVQERRRIGCAARRRVLEHFSFQRSMAQREQVYEEVIHLNQSNR